MFLKKTNFGGGYNVKMLRTAKNKDLRNYKNLSLSPRYLL